MNKDEKKAHDKAIEYFKTLGIWERGMVLHHIDPELKTKDPERYHEWRIDDVVPLTVRQHMAIHMRMRMKGIKKTDKHREAMKAGHRKERRNCNIMIHRVVRGEDGVEGLEAYVFRTCKEAARHVGCSLQMVYQTASGTQRNRRAMGWTCTYVPKSVDVGKVAEEVVKALVA